MISMLDEIIVRRTSCNHCRAHDEFPRFPGSVLTNGLQSDSGGARTGGNGTMRHYRQNGVVHLELHTHDQAEVRAFLWELLGWRSWQAGPVDHDYLALSVGDRVGGGIVECGQRPPSWLPYIGVGDVGHATERACELGASVLLPP